MTPSMFSAFEGKDDMARDNGARALLRHLQSKNFSDDTLHGTVRKVVSPFMVRRTKKDERHSDLPDKTEVIVMLEMTSVQKLLYEITGEKGPTNTTTDRTELVHQQTQRRKVAHHPSLLRTKFNSPEEQKQLADLLLKYGWFRIQRKGITVDAVYAAVYDDLKKWSDLEIHLVATELLEEKRSRAIHLDPYILTEDDLFLSAKYKLLGVMFPALVQEGHRTLVFTEWVCKQEMACLLLENLGIRYLLMNGGTPVSERQALMDKFSSSDEYPVFLLSTKACGVGINLTKADTVIMMDQCYNPSNDKQAEEYVVFSFRHSVAIRPVVLVAYPILLPVL